MGAIQYATFLAAFAVMLASVPAVADPKTVCTITVNSSDEAESFRRHLPAAQYRFVELVDKGRGDWLRTSCERQVQCDVLLVSGHFNAGDVFYSDRLGSDAYLSVDELERASCSGSCPGIFAKLKEVYLFGCESLNADASRYASSHGDSGLERMRRIFAGVPVIYGFSAAAPVGASAATQLDRYFAQARSGQVNARLLAAFSRNRMVATSGLAPRAESRRDICPFFDARLAAAQKIGFVHGVLRGDPGISAESVERVGHLLEAIPAAERADAAYVTALAQVSADGATRSRFMAQARARADAAARWKTITLAESLGWLTPDARATELAAMVREMLARPALGMPEVELVCALDAAGALESETFSVTPRAGRTSHAAALACLGNSEARAQVLAALTSSDEGDVRVAQVYLRNRPVSDVRELREMARRISDMPGSAAQVRAFDTFGRLSVADVGITAELLESFITATSLDVQRAIAEVFLRSGTRRSDNASLAQGLRRHRLRSAGADDLIEVLIRRLNAAA
jgi:hypothetical protein